MKNETISFIICAGLVCGAFLYLARAAEVATADNERQLHIIFTGNTHGLLEPCG